MEPGLPSGSNDTEDMHGLEETKGCAVLDSGATAMCSSTTVAEEIQSQRLNQQEPGLPTVSTSDRHCCFADGRVAEAQQVVEQQVTSGLLVWKSFEMHLNDRAGKHTCPLPKLQRRAPSPNGSRL